MSLPPVTIKNITIDPPLIMAPMAGITHSAFRRLVADFGGYGVLCTEMLSVRALQREVLDESPYTRRRAHEGRVWYQLLVDDDLLVAPALQRLCAINPFAIDINCACPAPEIIHRGAGAALYRNRERLVRVLDAARSAWSGILSIKIRLGDDTPQWEEVLSDRLRLFEQYHIDALFLHGRFSNEKLKRLSRWHKIAGVAMQTSIPVIGNGDLVGADNLSAVAQAHPSIKGFMIGRGAVVRPWIFAEISGAAITIDYTEVWTRLFNYVCEDFSSEKALGRIKEFSAFYARNFFFGHVFFTAIQSAPDLKTLYERAQNFLKRDPQISQSISVGGI